MFAWSGAELFVIIVCGSVPPTKPIYDRFFGKSGSRIGYTKNQYGCDSKAYGSNVTSSLGNRPTHSHDFDMENYPPPAGYVRKATDIRIAY